MWHESCFLFKMEIIFFHFKWKQYDLIFFGISSFQMDQCNAESNGAVTISSYTCTQTTTPKSLSNVELLSVILCS